MAGGGSSPHRMQNRIPGQPAGLSPEQIEVMPGAPRKPPKAAEADSGRYPPEYRKMISDYFKAVAEQR